MILGVALPHEHITWFATKVEAVPVSEAALIPPAKGKKVTNAALFETINSSDEGLGELGSVLYEGDHVVNAGLFLQLEDPHRPRRDLRRLVEREGLAGEDVAPRC